MKPIILNCHKCDFELIFLYSFKLYDYYCCRQCNPDAFFGNVVVRPDKIISYVKILKVTENGG